MSQPRPFIGQRVQTTHDEALAQSGCAWPAGAVGTITHIEYNERIFGVNIKFDDGQPGVDLETDSSEGVIKNEMYWTEDHFQTNDDESFLREFWGEVEPIA